MDSSIESWILDFHSSPNKELFRNFKSENFEVYLADNKDLEIKGKRDVCIKTLAGNQWTLKDVRYISGLKKNLIFIWSVGHNRLCNRVREEFVEDYEGRYGGSTWHKIWNLIHHCRVYEHIASVAESDSNSSLCHNRLGHMSLKGMKMLASKGVLEGSKSIDVGPCENCVMSKHKRVSFTRTARELKKVWLEMIHTNVEQGSKTTKQVRVELELRGNSLSDVVADTHETPETTAEEPDVEQGSTTTKQVGVELEL